MNSRERMSLTLKKLHHLTRTRIPVLEKKFALQSSHLAISDMLVRQKLIKRFLAYRKYETQFARQKVMQEILAHQKAVRFTIAFSLCVLNFLHDLLTSDMREIYGIKMYKLYCNGLHV